MARVRAGDREAYAVLVRRYAAQAHRTAVLVGAGADADDVVQLAFVKAYRNMDSFRDGAPFRPWLLRIVMNEAKNAARASTRRRLATERSAVADPSGFSIDPTADPASETLSKERRAELLDAVRKLPEPQQRVVLCRYFLDLDEQETARVLGWRRGTVKSRLHRALRRLHSWLDEPSAQDEPSPTREVDHE
ncbi:RNA polymerase sigma factor [Haloactinopolyspora alba]|uniref:RNA polymerase sigma factor n=1 Tax=Haloactinopolyspora alba TaxID=648780 RepID=UPI0023EA6A6C|nr:sigma-70 family RNA polymerase sigma factor [Haloactinopolyspora alba]